MICLAVIGDPIAHSFSPAVHGAALEAVGAAYSYDKIQVKKGELSAFLEEVQKRGLDGFNLTMPHKVDILPYLQETDREAQRYASVNTVRVRDGKLYGYNTDGNGFTASLEAVGRSFVGSRVVILGAGGVVRTLALKAAWEKAEKLTILNRTVSKAGEIAEKVEYDTGLAVVAGSLEPNEIARSCSDCDILIHATPVGMHGVEQQFDSFDFLDSLPQHALVADLIYNPQETRLLHQASKRGHAVLNGLGMLIYQALLADEIYLETQLDIHTLYRRVVDKLMSD